MKIALISDIHGNLEALNATMNDIKKRNVDKIFCLGDIVAKGYHDNECIDIIRKECEVVIRGNCDRHFTTRLEDLNITQESEIEKWKVLDKKITQTNKEYLKNLPYSFEFYLSGSLIRIFHATPEADNVALVTQDRIEDKFKMFLPSSKTVSDKVADIVIYGHIHSQYMDKLYNKTLLDVGSVGNSFCVIRNPEKDSNVKEIAQAHYCIIEGNYGATEYSDTLSIQFVRVDYEIEKELNQEYYFQKEEFDFELQNALYRNMEKIRKHFANLGIDMEKF